MVVNNLISFGLTLVLVFITPLMIAYSGFLMVVNQGNSAGLEKAKSVLTNTVVGIVVALASWMIVDAIMAVLYNSGARSGGTTLTTWTSLITSNGNDFCIEQKGSEPGAVFNPTKVTPTSVGATGLNPPLPGTVGAACDPAAVQAAAAAGGYQLTAAQANTFACIAKPESSCGAPQNPPNYNWNSAKSSPGSSAAGAFQVLLSTNHAFYENKACYAAVGLPADGSVKLNCQNGFDSSGNPKTDSAGAAVVQKCLQAASDLNCSASTAAALMLSSGFSPWQADVNSAIQTGCINNSGG
jgi:hypothetical protein